MSLERTALRLAACDAMRSDPVIRSLCDEGNRVWDSRMALLGPCEPDFGIIVTTEQSEGHAWSQQNGGPSFNDTCKLTIEIAARGVEFDDRGELLGLLFPVTDREMEATLDLLEHRVRFLFGGDARTPQARLLRKVARRVTSYEAERFSGEDDGEKLAIRLAHITVEIIGDDAYDARIVPTGPYAVLPNPLRMVCEAMPDGSSGQRVCQMFVGHFPPLEPEPVLGRAGFSPTLSTVPPPNSIPLDADFPIEEP